MNQTIEITLQVIFWISALGIMHSYGVYPLIMSVLNYRKAGERARYSEKHLEELPSIHVVFAMYNEDSVIEKTLESIVSSDYPREKLTVHIGSDDSTDRSHEIVQSFNKNHPFIHLQVFKGRNGKIKIVNELIKNIPRESESVLILCDANVVWSESLPKRLARHFKNPKIGIVAANVVDAQANTNGIALQEEAYVNHENSVKHAEGVYWGRMMGAFGACYAMRRSIYEEVPEHFNVDDFYQTLACYEQGYDGVVDLEAVCYEAVSEVINEEFRRKKRISKGNFQNLRKFSVYLLPWNCGWPTFFAFWSHKGLRWFGPMLLMLIFASGMSITLVEGDWFYGIAMIGMVSSFVLAMIDQLIERKRVKIQLRLCRFIRYFYAMNAALFAGGVEFCRGVSHSVWEPTKRVTS